MEDIVDKYLKIQATMKDLEKKHREQMMVLETEFESISKKLLDACEKNKTDLIPTSSGTITRKSKTTYTTTDWDAMYRLMKKHSAFSLLEKRIHVSNLKAFLEANPDVDSDFITANKTYSVTVSKKVKVANSSSKKPVKASPTKPRK